MLGNDAIPFLIPAYARRNSAFRKSLLSWEAELAPDIPASILQKLVDATNVARDQVAAKVEMDLFTGWGWVFALERP